MNVSPYASLLRLFGKKKVRYVVIGLSGINYYAGDPGDYFATKDIDVLIEPSAANLLRALESLEKAGFALESNGEPVVGVDLELCRRIISHKAVITARREELRIDVVLDGGRIPYSEWKENAKTFLAEGIPVCVGGLPTLIEAKKNADRPKDRRFLAEYKARLKEMLKSWSTRGSVVKDRARSIYRVKKIKGKAARRSRVIS